MSIVIKHETLGIVLPDIPTTYEAAFPYSTIVHVDTEGGYFCFRSDKPLVAALSADIGAPCDIVIPESMNKVGFACYSYSADSDSWVEANVVEADGWIELPNGTVEGTTGTLLWTNYDIMVAEAGSYAPTSTVYFPNSLAKPPFVLPDGTELPAPPEGCFEKYPYGIVGQNTGQYYALVVSRTPGIYHEAGEQFSVPTLVFEKNPGYVVYLYKPENDTGWWVYTDSSGDGEGNNFAAGSMATTDWCNYDVVYENGALYRKSDVNYRIYGGWLNSMGNQARRLGGVSGELKPGEMESVFRGVTAGITLAPNEYIYQMGLAESVSNASDFKYETNATGVLSE